MDRTTINSSRGVGPTLSQRLNQLRLFHAGADTVWDIGCDHGLLGLSFVDQEEVKAIHLVDPSLAVMDELKKKLEDTYITIRKKIELHFQRGQDVIIPNSGTHTIFIAGMGGKEIIEILACLRPMLKEQDRLIVSPHRKVLELREWLGQSDYAFIDEVVALENGQFYPILCLSKGSGPKVHPYGNEAFWRSITGKSYLKQQVAAFSGHQDQTSKAYLKFLKDLSR